MIQAEELFSLIKTKLDNAVTELRDSKRREVRGLAWVFNQRLRSMKTASGQDTKEYSRPYYEYRLTHFGYKNVLHNYYLTGTLQKTLKFFYEASNIFYESEAPYLEDLVQGRLSSGFHPLVYEAFRFSNEEMTIIKSYLSKIFIDGYTRKV